MENKIKFCVYLSKEEKILLDELLIKKIKQGKKPNKTEIFTDALKLFYDREMKNP